MYDFSVSKRNDDGKWFSHSLYELEDEFGRAFDDHGSGMGVEDGTFCDVPLEELEHLIEVSKKYKLTYWIDVEVTPENWIEEEHTSPELFKHRLISLDTRGIKGQYYWKHVLHSAWVMFRRRLEYLNRYTDKNWQLAFTEDASGRR